MAICHVRTHTFLLESGWCMYLKYQNNIMNLVWTEKEMFFVNMLRGLLNRILNFVPKWRHLVSSAMTVLNTSQFINGFSFDYAMQNQEVKSKDKECIAWLKSLQGFVKHLSTLIKHCHLVITGHNGLQNTNALHLVASSIPVYAVACVGDMAHANFKMMIIMIYCNDLLVIIYMFYNTFHFLWRFVTLYYIVLVPYNSNTPLNLFKLFYFCTR